MNLNANLTYIGSRWRPGSVVRRDTGTGFFEHVNPLDYSNDALWVQQALIAKPPKRGLFSWYGVLPVLCALAAAGLLGWVVGSFVWSARS